MTDQIPADKVEKIAAEMRAAMRRDEHAYPEAKFLADLSGYIKDLEALLPPRPTLADMTPGERTACMWMHANVEMTPEERAECRRMHADAKGDDTHVVILDHHEEDGRARVLWLCGCNKPAAWEKVTPRPDLAAAVYYEGTNHD